MVFKAVFALTVLLVVGSSTLVGGRLLGLIDDPPGATTTICDALSPAERRALVGAKTPYAAERTTGDGTEQSCRWTVTRDDTSFMVEVTTMGAGHWVVGLTRALADHRGSADAALRKVMKRALTLGSAADDRAACALASRVFELQGAKQGSRQHVSYRPGRGRTSPRMVAEECIAGTYTRIVAAAPRLARSSVLERRTLTTLGQVRQPLS